MIPPLHTWTTVQGQLDLFDQPPHYRLQLTTKDHSVIPLDSKQVLSFLPTDQTVEDVCNQYLPQIRRNGTEGWSVMFYSCAVPGKLVDGAAQQHKNIGAFSFEFNNLEKKRFIQFSKDAPFYRRVIQGLNLQGECENNICEAYQKTVYIPKGIGSFNIAQMKNRSQCPACEQKVPFEKIRNLGFWDCRYTIDGQPSDSDEEISKTATAEKERYTTFSPGESYTWEYLQVTTETIAPPEAPNATRNTHNSSQSCAIV